MGIKKFAMMAMAMTMTDNPHYRMDLEDNEKSRKRKQHIQETALRNAINKQRQREYEFTIKGHYVIAKSRKDAIKILKHKGFLK